ncbi:phosphatase PAP2 family protein [Sphingomonas glacialis]|uniref:Phosphatase PAP2 family protein n=1 Tax=Sphingomonas glacialis TaxID=658225 RepID=A0ABQ3LTV2_9SPHN|nr:phosphatase PAP2 family protein [Sphingomonas glacialis]
MIGRARAYARERPELVVLLAFALTALTLLIIFYLGSEVMEGDTEAFDIAVLTRLRHATEGDAPWKTALRAAMLDLTALGDNATLVIVVAMVSGFLTLARQRQLALLLVAASATGGLLTTALKLLFDRPRPNVVAHLASFGTASFPSGHAMNSAVIYLTLAGLVALAVPTLRLRVYILCCAVALTSAIGLSRLYLGVHWTTDVVAGWIAGSGWAVLWWSIAWWFRAHKAYSPK